MHRAMRRVTNRVDQVSYQELNDITQIWVDAAMELPSQSLKTMERLVKAQRHRVGTRDTEATNY